MTRIILLNDKQFPNGFNSIQIIPPTGIDKKKYVEKKIIKAINAYNPKLNVSYIEYLQIEEQFPDFKKSKSNGALIEEIIIKPSEISKFSTKNYYVYNNEGITYARRILLYLFLSNADESGRNGFVSQVVFPTLLDYAGKYLDSPSYTIANHKFCFINIMNKELTSNMILRHLAGLCLLELDYIEVFKNSLNPKNIPTDLKEFLKEYITDYYSHYDVSLDIYDDNNYRIDFSNKIFKIKTEAMISKLVMKGTNVDFNGSGEKFYWVEILPVCLNAYNQGYSIDYSEYEDFIRRYETRFSSSSEKFSRCQILLKYIKKYCI